MKLQYSQTAVGVQCLVSLIVILVQYSLRWEQHVHSIYGTRERVTFHSIQQELGLLQNCHSSGCSGTYHSKVLAQFGISSYLSAKTTLTLLHNREYIHHGTLNQPDLYKLWPSNSVDLVGTIWFQFSYGKHFSKYCKYSNIQ